MTTSRSKLPEGYFSPGDVGSYRILVDRLPMHGILVELGTFYGRSICSVAKIVHEKRLRVFLVDTFVGVPEHKGTYECGLPDSKIERRLIRNLDEFELTDCVTICRMTTVQAARAQRIPTNVDAVFVDADHDPKAVRLDIRTWWPRIRLGGWMAGHDYAPSSREAVLMGVTDTVRGEFGSRVQKLLPRSTVWFVDKKTRQK